ncbi:hypothetical protein GEMRC1_011030 [Eukaryota sp. GEM-RC1]
MLKSFENLEYSESVPVESLACDCNSDDCCRYKQRAEILEQNFNFYRRSVLHKCPECRILSQKIAKLRTKSKQSVPLLSKYENFSPEVSRPDSAVGYSTPTQYTSLRKSRIQTPKIQNLCKNLKDFKISEFMKVGFDARLVLIVLF